jgi:hypothetical protein
MNNFLITNKKITRLFYLLLLVPFLGSCIDEDVIGEDLVKTSNVSIHYDTTFFTLNNFENKKGGDLFSVSFDDIQKGRTSALYVGKIDDNKFGPIDAQTSFMFRYYPTRVVKADTMIIKKAELFIGGGSVASSSSTTLIPNYPYEMPTTIEVYSSNKFPRRNEADLANEMGTGDRLGGIANFLPYTDFSKSSTKVISVELDTSKLTPAIIKDVFFNNELAEYYNKNKDVTGVVDSLDQIFLKKDFPGLTVKAVKGSLFAVNPLGSYLKFTYGTTANPDTTLAVTFPVRNNQNFIDSKIDAFENRIIYKNDNIPAGTPNAYVRGFDAVNVPFTLNRKDLQLKENENLVVTAMNIIIPVDTSDIFVNPIATVGVYCDTVLKATGTYSSTQQAISFNLTNSLIDTTFTYDNLCIRASKYAPNRAILKMDSMKVETFYSRITK